MRMATVQIVVTARVPEHEVVLFRDVVENETPRAGIAHALNTWDRNATVQVKRVKNLKENNEHHLKGNSANRARVSRNVQ